MCGSACSPGLGLLGSPRLASASLALPAPATTAAALRRPGCCCEVQARRARPIRGEVSQARQGQGPSTVFYLAYLGPVPFIWPMPWHLHGFFYLSGPCTRLYLKTRMLGLTWTHQKLENGRIGTLEAPPQLRTTSERSSGLLSVAWMA